jgi:hypothetical protein
LLHIQRRSDYANLWSFIATISHPLHIFSFPARWESLALVEQEDRHNPQHHMGWLSAGPSRQSWISTSSSSRGAPSLRRARKARHQSPRTRQQLQEPIQLHPQRTPSLLRNGLRLPMLRGLLLMHHLYPMVQFQPILLRHRRLQPRMDLDLC